MGPRGKRYQQQSARIANRTFNSPLAHKDTVPLSVIQAYANKHQASMLCCAYLYHEPATGISTRRTQLPDQSGALPPTHGDQLLRLGQVSRGPRRSPSTTTIKNACLPACQIPVVMLEQH